MRHKDEGKRQAIVNASIELITQNGFAETSMSKIAKAANVSPATIYVYFENKEELLNYLYMTVKRELFEALTAGVDTSGNVRDEFRQIWFNAYRYISTHPQRFAFSEQFANSPLVNRVREDEIADFYSSLVILFKRGIEEKCTKDISIYVFAAFFLAPLMALTKSSSNGDVVLTDSLLNQAFDMTWEAISV